MPAILAPKPVVAALSCPVARLVSPPPIYRTPLTRLCSPIQLPDSCIRPSVSLPLVSTPKPPSCNPKRRRSKPTSHTLRRRRPLSRVEFRVEPPPPHFFDSLPWISALDSTPEHIHPWDIADLSLLPDLGASGAGPGPVRRRKTSLRSSPIAASRHSVPAASVPGEPFPLGGVSDPMWAGSTLPAAASSDTPFCLSPPPTAPPPHTPRSRFVPSRVLFQNLMPVSFADAPSPPSCIHNAPFHFEL